MPRVEKVRRMGLTPRWHEHHEVSVPLSSTHVPTMDFALKNVLFRALFFSCAVALTFDHDLTYDMTHVYLCLRLCCMIFFTLWLL